MSGRRPHPRSGLPSSRQTYPEFGAKHNIVYDDALDAFFTDAYSALETVIPDEKFFDDHANLKRSRRAFRIYDDPKKVGITVLERRLPRNYGYRQRVKWTANDVGRIKGQIQNEVARLSLGNQILDATFSQVVRLGDADEGPNARKLGLILEQNSTVAELMVAEHKLVIGGISGSLKRFKYPFDKFIPHWTVARVRSSAGPKPLNDAVSQLQELMPLTVQLEPLRLYSEQDIEI